jgi:molecular chaperone DnaK (HSP70)
MSEEYETVIGLSFGNTSSSIAVEKDGKAEVIANQDGDRAIPSVLSYVHSDEFHGLQAKNQLIRNPKNTVTYFRDFIGKPFADVDPTYNHASAHPLEKDGFSSFSVVTAEGAEPEQLSIDKIVTRHLDRLRESAADFIGKKIDGAVVAVPTDFTEAQKKALVADAAAADLKILQIINEPTAALLAHVAARSSNKTGSLESKLILVLDIGGTRTDGAVITNRGGIFTILNTHHNYELGGYKLDDALMEHFAKEFQKAHDVDPRKEARAVAKLRAESEAVKKTLSNTNSASFAVESLASGIDFHTTINRLRFELCGRPVFNQLTSFVETLIKKSGFDALEFDEVLLAGGSSFVPKVVSTVSALFDTEKTSIIAPSVDTKAINPDELVARGAALQASLISIYEQQEIDESLQAVVTVAPHTSKPIGVKVEGTGSDFVTIVDANTPLPFRTSRVFETGEAENVLIAVHEGDAEIVVTKLEKAPVEADEEDSWSDEEEDEEVRTLVYKAGKKLAEAGLEGITKGSKVEVQINITRELKLQVAAREVKQGGVAVRGDLPNATLA